MKGAEYRKAGTAPTLVISQDTVAQCEARVGSKDGSARCIATIYSLVWVKTVVPSTTGSAKRGVGFEHTIHGCQRCRSNVQSATENRLTVVTRHSHSAGATIGHSHMNQRQGSARLHVEYAHAIPTADHRSEERR